MSRHMRYPIAESRDGVLDSVVEAVNSLSPDHRMAMFAALRVHMPAVRWFSNARGIVDAEPVDAEPVDAEPV